MKQLRRIFLGCSILFLLMTINQLIRDEIRHSHQKFPLVVDCVDNPQFCK